MVAPPKNERIIKVNAIAYANLIKLLMEGDCTCEELAEETGLHYVTVLQYTRELHRAQAVYVCAWGRDAKGAYTRRIYKIGTRPDAARPSITSAERTRKYRERQKAKQQFAFLYGDKDANQATGS